MMYIERSRDPITGMIYYKDKTDPYSPMILNDASDYVPGENL